MSTTGLHPQPVHRAMASRALLALCCAFLSAQASAQEPLVSPPRDDPLRTEPVEGFHLIDGIYFVGARLNLPVYLFTTPDGHILIDTTYEEFVPEIVANIEKLGFDVGDIEIMLSTHAHHDHVGGHAKMRALTGATTMATAADADVIESGGETDFRDRGLWAPATVDRIIADGERVRLGKWQLTAHLTPGHTKGCTTWTTVVEEQGRQYDLALLCGVRVNTNVPLVGNELYPDMPQQFAWTFARLKVLPVDVYLGAHGYWFDLGRKRELLLAGTDSNPFIDPAGYRNAIRFWENAYLERLAKELASGDTQ